jgi:alpha,alpha-trehalase
MSEAFDVVIDGADAAERDLAGKPAPDVFLAAAKELGVEPADAVVVEDAVAGVQAAREGGFGMVVGVARTSGEGLRVHGADTVVRDLDELDLAQNARSEREAPSALERFQDVARRIGPCRVALFLDYDGTLTPIVDDPDDALLGPEMRARIRAFADEATVAVVSGRDLQDVRSKVGIEDLVYAGSHGYDIAGPGGMEMRNEQAEARLDELEASEEALRGRLGDVSGVAVERKRYAIAVHYRNASDADIERVRAAVEEVGEAHDGLRVKGGKAIFELQPDVDWHKGRAVRWLLGQLDLDRPDVVPIYVGDDVTDEDAFAELGEGGIGIRVGPPDQETAADFVLRDPDELGAFLDDLKEHLAADHRDDGRRLEPR